MTHKVQTSILIISLLCSLLTIFAPAQNKGGSTMRPPAAVAARGDNRARSLQELVDRAARETVAGFAAKGFKEENLAITLIDLRDPQRPRLASFRGEERIYPASVVKLFYLSAAQRWLEDGKLRETDELRRAMRDMIVDSNNDAMQYMVDVLTDTTAGPELPPEQMQQWAMKRNSVNRYYTSLGYTNINVNQKTFCEDSYGREHAFRGAKGENRNKLTTNATARLLSEIATGKAVTPARSSRMMELLKREFAGKSDNPDNEPRGFTGGALPAGARIWSKAGWTSAARHDAAYIELPDGARFVLVTFTTDSSKELEIIPTVARIIIAGIGSIK